MTFSPLGPDLAWLTRLVKARVKPIRTRKERDLPEEAKTHGTQVPSRRELVKKSAQVAVTAPAVALLLNASTKPAFAQAISPSAATTLHILDDFTFGNTREDVDAIHRNTNFGSGFNNAPLQDDHV